MSCTQCGSPLSEQSKFCARCGAKREVVEVNQQNEKNNRVHQHHEVVKEQGGLKTKNNITALGVSFSLLLVVGLTIIVLLFYYATHTPVDNVSNVDNADNAEVIEFGGFEWRILDVREGRALIVTDKIIESRPFHSEWINITWADSDLRAYLNGEFLDNFSIEEQNQIAETVNHNQDNPWYGTYGGSTTDYVFLLSLEEVVEYFGDSGRLTNREHPNNTGWGFNDRFGAVRIANHGRGQAFPELDMEVEENEPWVWWLRSPGIQGSQATTVDGDGAIDVFGQGIIKEYVGVRPALWLEL
jgi:hypothetical protein